MKEINIARTIVNKRKEKGVTQDEMAGFFGVSKASISKWETGLSYPDITLLPRLAAYFNMTIDDLMGYEPQMTREEIRRLYLRLSADITSRPFDEVLQECREITRKYYACFPLLQQMGVFIVNHSALAPDQTAALLHEAKELFIRVKRESSEVELAKQARHLEAVCCIALGDPEGALDLLKGSNSPLYSGETLLAAAYQMTGQNAEAKAVLQVGIYQHILTLMGIFPSYLAVCVNDPARYDQVLRRAMEVVEAFDLKHLHPAVIFNLYISAAQGYMAQGRNDDALNMLDSYVNLATGDIYPLRLHGDGFFDSIDEWLKELDLGTEMPRDEKTVRQSMADVVKNNPVFAGLAGLPRFQSMVEKLDHNHS